MTLQRFLAIVLGPGPTGALCTCLLLVLSGTAAAEEKRNWLDRSHGYVTDRGDALARQLDDFFGVPVSDVETASSILRLAVEYDMDEIESNDWKFKARGKLRLPRISKRASLVFEGEDSDDEASFSRAGEDNGTDQVGLQYELGEGGRSRFDVFGAIRSGVKGRAGIRYRFQDAPSDHFSWRFIEQLAYDQDDKTISTTRLNLDRLVDDNSSLRWASRVRYGEETDGVEWRSNVGWREVLTSKSAITYFVGINGITDPENVTKSWGPGIRYRRNVFRDYLFLDLEPAYSWRKQVREDWEPDTDREGAWSFSVRLEIFFEKQKAKAE